jgi:hypothetical protein
VDTLHKGDNAAAAAAAADDDNNNNNNNVYAGILSRRSYIILNSVRYF